MERRIKTGEIGNFEEALLIRIEEFPFGKFLSVDCQRRKGESEWRTDPEAGILVPLESADRFIDACEKVLQEQRRKETKWDSKLSSLGRQNEI